MARQQKLIHLHGTSPLSKEAAANAQMVAGELAVMNGTQETSELYVLTSDGNIATFVTGAKVAGDIATAKSGAETTAKDYADAAQSAAEATAKSYTDGVKTDLQGKIDALSDKVGATDVAAQIQAAVAAEAKTREEEDAEIRGEFAAADTTTLNSAKADATTKANTAETNAKAYADSLAKNYDAAGSADAALEDAKDYADGLASNYDAAGSADAALEDAKGYANGLNTAMDTRVKALEADTHTHENKDELDKIADGDKARWDDAADAIEAFMDAENVGDAVVDTLKEIQEYITTDGTAASTMTQNIAKNAQDIAAEAARAKGAEAGLQTAIDAKVAQTVYDAKVAELVAADETNAQDIADEAARAKGAEADLQAAIDAIEADYLKAADKTELQGNIDAVDAAYKAADTIFTTALNAAKDRIETLEKAGYVKAVSVENSEHNLITATEDVNGTVTLNFDNMVIDCGTYE